LYPSSEIDFIHKESSIWQLFNKRILITGGTGFVGSWLTESLRYVTSVTSVGREYYDDALKGNYDLIFHCAPTPIEPILACAYRNGAKILFTSSGVVYGPLTTRAKESDPTNPKTQYALEKVRSEILLKNSGLDYVIARMFTFAGQGMRDKFAITAFVKAAREGKPINVFGDGKSIRSYLYAADLALWLITLMIDGKGIYNVGSEREISFYELAETVSDMSIPRTPIIMTKPDFIEPSRYYVPDCAKAHELGLKQNYSLEYAIKRMYETI